MNRPEAKWINCPLLRRQPGRLVPSAVSPVCYPEVVAGFAIQDRVFSCITPRQRFCGLNYLYASFLPPYHFLQTDFKTRVTCGFVYLSRHALTYSKGSLFQVYSRFQTDFFEVCKSFFQCLQSELRTVDTSMIRLHALTVIRFPSKSLYLKERLCLLGTCNRPRLSTLDRSQL